MTAADPVQNKAYTGKSISHTQNTAGARRERCAEDLEGASHEGREGYYEGALNMRVLMGLRSMRYDK